MERWLQIVMLISHHDSFYDDNDDYDNYDEARKVDDFHRELGAVEGETAKVNGELAAPH